MSETPTMPLSDVKTDRVTENTDRIMDNPRMQAEFFEQAERQVAPQPRRDEIIDLNEPDQLFPFEEQPAEAVAYAAPPEYVTETKTHAQNLTEYFEQLDYHQLLMIANTTTAAIPAMRRLV